MTSPRPRRPAPPGCTAAPRRTEADDDGGNMMTRRIRGAFGLVVLLALAVGLPWALAATIGNPLDQWSSIRSGDMSERDVIAIMAAVAYLAWASFAIALLVELTVSLA